MSFKTELVPFEATMQVALRVLEGIDTPRSLSVWLLSKYCLVDFYDPTAFSNELSLLDFNPNNYDQNTIDKLRDDYCATVLLSKLPPKEESPALRAAALDSLNECERSSLNTAINWCNESKIEAELDPFFYDGLPLNELRRAFARVMGRAPSLSKVIERSSFTAGASLMLSRRKASPASKCVSPVSVTPDLAKLLLKNRPKGASIFDLHPLWANNAKWFLSPGNLVSTVPKNIKTDRTIAMEPEINQFLQRGLGELLSSRLKSFGIDLHDQSLNQRACLRANTCKYATIDFKNASNSIVARVVESLIPPDWWALLDACRSKYGTTDDRKHLDTSSWFEYHMMSSMGNGFTFELESVLFFSVCLALGVPEYDIYVYGDDLIIPQQFVESAIAVFKILGLQVNMEKSFTSGAFFESCGVYAFHGIDVTPFKIKDLLNGDKECIILANKIRWFSHSITGYNGCDRRFLSAYRYCCHRISSATYTKCRGPLNGTIALWCNVSETPLRYSCKRGSLHTFHLTPVSLPEKRRRTSEHVGLLYFRLFEGRFGLPVDAVGLPIPRERKGNFLRDETSTKYTISHQWIPERTWYEPGDWS
mgnify:CR=1 FL=1